MLKKILNLNGAKELNQKEKKSIQGGLKECMFWDNECKEYGPQCAELECALIPFP